MKQHPQIILNAIGGLGNRIKTILAARQLSSLTQRELKVVWHTDSGCNAAVEKLFDTSAFDFETISPDNLEYMLKYEIPRKKNLYLSAIHQGSMLCFRDGKERLPEELVSQSIRQIKESDKTVFIATGIMFLPFPSESCRTIFRPSQNVKELLLDSFAVDDTEHLIGVHIRRTDHIQAIRNSPMNLFIEQMSRSLDQDKQTRFYIASDDEKCKQEIISHFGTSRIITNQHKADRSTPQGIIDAWCEMLTLAKCRLIYGSFNSTFSETAAMIGGKKLEIIKQ